MLSKKEENKQNKPNRHPIYHFASKRVCVSVLL